MNLRTKAGKMKTDNSKTIVMWSIVTLFFMTAAPAYCQVDDYVLMVEQTPVQGGEVTPSAGVHRFDLGDVITLSAVPNAGYQFMYWLGDVSEVASSSTTVLLDGPKIVIAVFQRAEFVFVLEEERSSVGMGSELTRYNYTYLGGGSASPGAYRIPERYKWPPLPPEEEEEEEKDDFPVPEQDFPVPEPAFPVPDNEVPIPEPATVFLLGLGGLILLRKKRRKHILKEKQG